ncbi:hypothetical protein GQ53DRAFT_835491 [Thozetella sp. PMI_491]|nr:hypothetical protein GQ53DRAFT_835491 [Thozetella sp. PMI_491]
MFFKLATVVFALAGSAIPVLGAPFPEAEAAVTLNATETDGNFQIAAATEKYGRGTVYLQNGVAGSCGAVHADGDYIVALSHAYMQHQYKNYHCGKRVRVYNTGSDDVNVKGKGLNVVAVVADSCDGCGTDDIDLSIGAWNSVTQKSAYSVFKAQWHFMD